MQCVWWWQCRYVVSGKWGRVNAKHSHQTPPRQPLTWQVSIHHSNILWILARAIIIHTLKAVSSAEAMIILYKPEGLNYYIYTQSVQLTYSHASALWAGWCHVSGLIHNMESMAQEGARYVFKLYFSRDLENILLLQVHIPLSEILKS